MMRALKLPSLLPLALLLASAACYEGISVPLDGLPCEEGACADGFLCDLTTDTCVGADIPSLGATTIEAGDSSIIADGTTTTTITVTVKNAAETPLPGLTVTLNTTFGELVDSVSDPGDGTYTQQLRAAEAVGTANLSFDLEGAVGESAPTTSVDFVPGLATGSIFLDVLPGQIVADGVSTANLTSGPISDEYGNVVGAGTLVSVATDGSTCIVTATECATATEVATDGRGILAAQVRSGTSSGFSTLTATVEGASGTTDLTLLPDVGAALAATGGTTQTAAAGTLLPQSLEVQVTDANGNPVPGVAVSWTVTGGGGGVSAPDSTTDGAGIASMTATLGPAQGTDNNLYEASVAGLTGSPAVFTASAVPGPVSAFSVIGPSSPTDAGVPFLVSVEATDAFGNVVVDYAGTVALGSTDPLAILPSSYTYQGVTDLGLHNFSVTLETAGLQGVTAVDESDSAILGTDPDIEIVSAAVAGLAFMTPPRTVTAGDCASVSTIGTVDSFGNPTPATSNTTVSLSSDSGTLLFFSDSACSNPITDVALLAGESSAALHTLDTTAGTPTLTGTATALSDGNQTLSVTPASPSGLTLPNSPLSVVAGACSSGLLVEVEDDFGNRARVGAVTTLDLSSDSPTLTFFSDSGCLSPITSVQLAAGAGGATVYFRDTAVGGPTLTVTEASLSPASQTEAIVPAPPAALGMATPPLNVNAGSCSSVLTVEILDAFGNVSPLLSAASIALTSDSATLFFYADGSCSTPLPALDLSAGATTGDLYFLDTVAGAPTLSLTSTGLLPVDQAQTVAAGPPVQLLFTTAPQTVVVGTCSLLTTVAVADAQGNPSLVSVSTAVTITADSPTLALFSDASCATPLGATVVIPPLSSSLDLYFQDPTSGSPSLTANAAGLTLAVQGQTVNPGSPSQLAFTSPVQTVPTGDCSDEVTLEVRDALDNPALPGSDVVVTLATDSATMTLYADATCTASTSSVTIAGGSSSAGFYFQDTTAGTPLLTATAVGLAAATRTPTIVPGTPSQFAFATPPQTLAAGACSAVVEIEVQDVNGNVAPATSPITLGIGSDSVTLVTYSDSSCTTPSSLATIATAATRASFYFRDNTAGMPTLTVAAASFPTTNQTHTVGPDVRSQLAFRSSPQGILQWACSAVVSIESLDQFGNTSPVFIDRPVDLGSDSPTLGFFADSSCITSVTSVTLAAGTSSASFYFRDSILGTPTITTTLRSTPITADQTEFILQPAADANSTLTATPSSLPGNGASISVVTVDLRDITNGPVPGQIVELVTTHGTLSSVTDNFAGTYTATLLADTAGTAILSYRVNSVDFTVSSASVTFTNLLPVADAGLDQADRLPWDTVALLGTVTDGNPGDTFTYLWSVSSQPAGADGRFGPSWPGNATASVPAVEFWPDLAGTYTLSLGVTDSAGGSASDTLTVTVSPFSQVPYPATFSAGKQQAHDLAVFPATGDLGMVTEDGAAIYQSVGTWAAIDCQPAGATVGTSLIVGPAATSGEAFYLGFDGSPVLTRIDAYSSAAGCTSFTAFDTSVTLGAPTRISSLTRSDTDELWIATDRDLTRLPVGSGTTVGDHEFTVHGSDQAWGALAFSHGGSLWAAEAADGYHVTALPFDPSRGHLDLDPGSTNAISYLLRGALIPASNVDEIWISVTGAGWWRIPDAGAAVPIQYTAAGSGLPGDDVGQAVFEDATGDLWVVTDAGLARYKRDVDAIVSIGTGTNGLCSGTLRGVASDGFSPATRGRILWVSCSDGLFTVGSPP